MSAPIATVLEGVPVNDLLWRLRGAPELWNANAMRTARADSPHREADDIWVRYAPDGVGAEPHFATWYPAEEHLRTWPTVQWVMGQIGATVLGGVLITRIPPGKQVYPHVDRGWHAETYEKFALQLASAPGQAFCFDGIAHETKPGDLFTFDNAREHWVRNNSEHERVTMIVCVRRV